MGNIHPSSTAGDGRLKFRRTTYAPNDRVVELIRCAQCGFPFRDRIDSEGETADSPTITQVPQTVTVSADNTKLPQHLKDNAAYQNGATVTITSDQTLGGGCRLCGSMNPRGNGRNNRDWSGRPSMENR